MKKKWIGMSMFRKIGRRRTQMREVAREKS
jgi:hypothetical protein